MNIDDHIQKNIKILEDLMISPETRRHIYEELESLKKYKNNHPDEIYDPSSLELYCDTHLDALECRMYDD